jgi:hypothetical protein
MRIFIVSVILIAIGGCLPKTPTGCSPKTLMVHHILPVGFSGVYVVQKGRDDSDVYKVEGESYILTIPESGILKVTPDTFENYCFMLGSCRRNIRLTASFSDGKTIAMYSPLSPPADSELDNPLLHIILGAPDSIWFAVGNYKQLKEFDEKWRKELPEKIKLDKYGGLERYLPHNTPFQTGEQAGKD